MFLGNVNSVNPLQPSKAFSSNFTKPSPSGRLVNEEQFLNVLLPIVVVAFGSVTFCRLVQPSNIRDGKTVKDASIMTFSRLVHPVNASLAMDIIFSGIEILFSFVL